MPRLTAIEFGDDTCVLVRVSTSGTSIEVGGVDTLDPAAFPGTDTFTSALRQARKSGNFPRRARVVLWGVAEGASVSDPLVRPRLEPLFQAGFRVERVVSPCDALATLARIRVPKPESATIWLAVDPGGVAIVATRPGELLYSKAFPWDSSVGAIGSQARLLQRYSLVAHLAPEVMHAMSIVRERGAQVDAVVTCGTLPDLRSLTMPLIDELDAEVETLDSLAGLTAPDALLERLQDAAPAIRLACAGALARPARAREPQTGHATDRTWFRIAAVIAVVALLAVMAALLLPRLMHRAAQAPPQESHDAHQVTPPQQQPVRTSGSPVPEAQPQAKAQKPQMVPVTHPRPETAPPASADAGTSSASRSASGPPRSARPPAAGPRETRPDPVRSGEAQSAVPPETSVSQPGPIPGSRKPLFAAAPRADTPRSEPLKDPLPVVSTILVSEDRRLAMVDGRIVGVGDRVGQRTVAAIEPRVVVFREPSGVQIRVALGGRLASDDRINH
jgi:hypothetical protein